MKLVLLVEGKMEPIPEAIKVLEDWGDVTIRAEIGSPPQAAFIEGRHVYVEGEEEAIKKWLLPFAGVWLGHGPPMLQQFEVAHIRGLDPGPVATARAVK